MYFMKSNLLWFACAAVALSSCSNNEAEESIESGRTIAFQSSVSKNSRAIATNSNFSAFKVMAEKENGTLYFTEPITVTKVTDAKDPDLVSWETSQTYFWQSDPLNFYAYAPTNLQGVTIDEKARKIEDFSAQVDSDEEVNDLVIATRMGATWTNTYGPVSLTFKHALAQICIEGRMKTNANMKVDVIGAKICFIGSKGSVNFPTTTTKSSEEASFAWTLAENSTKDFGVCGKNYLTLTNENQSLTFGNSMLMIPQEVTAWPTNNDGSKMLTDKEGTEKGAYLAVLCKMYDINENGNYTMHYPKAAGKLFYTEADYKALGYAWAAVPVNINWVAGNRYTYVLTFSDNSAGYIDPLPSTGAPFDGLNVVKDPLSADTENPKELGDDILGIPITFGSISVDTFIEKNDASHHPLN